MNQNNNKYKFYHLDTKEQIDFVKNNLKRLVQIQKICTPSNINNSQNKIEEERYDIYMTQNIISWVNYNEEGLHKFFFLLDQNDLIIAYCICAPQNVNMYEGKEIIPTYILLSEEDNINNILKDFSEDVTLYPLISNFCKDQHCSGVGKILLDNVVNYYAENSEYTKVYLIPESAYHKKNYSTLLENICEIDNKKFFDSNMKLIKYYLDNGYIPSKNLFVNYKCSDKNMFLNVLYKNINVKY